MLKPAYQKLLVGGLKSWIRNTISNQEEKAHFASARVQDWLIDWLTDWLIDWLTEQRRPS